MSRFGTRHSNDGLDGTTQSSTNLRSALVEGVPVGMLFPTDEECALVFPKVEEAFGLLARNGARRLARFQKDVAGVFVTHVHVRWTWRVAACRAAGAAPGGLCPRTRDLDP